MWSSIASDTAVCDARSNRVRSAYVRRTVRSLGTERMDASSGKRTRSAQTRLTVSAFSTNACAAIAKPSSSSNPSGLLSPLRNEKQGRGIRLPSPISYERVFEGTRPFGRQQKSVTLRQLPGATVLGLVVALASHAVLFGGEHAWGGAYHGALLELTLATVAGLTAGTAALLFSGARCAADGTVLAARMRDLLPAWSSVAVSGALWFTLGERLEAGHSAVPLLAIVLILVLAAWLLVRFAAAALRVLARIVFAIARLVQCQDEPVESPLKLPAALRQAQRDTAWCRRFSRPPPIAFALTRA